MVVGFDVVVSDESVVSVESVVVFDDGVSEVCEGVDDAPVSEGVVVDSSDVVVVGGSVVVSDWESVVDVVESDEVWSAVLVVPELGIKPSRIPEESCRICTTFTTLFLAATSSPPAFWTPEMRCPSPDKTKEATNRVRSDNLAGCIEENMMFCVKGILVCGCVDDWSSISVVERVERTEGNEYPELPLKYLCIDQTSRRRMKRRRK